jgi:hypothetical protein
VTVTVDWTEDDVVVVVVVRLVEVVVCFVEVVEVLGDVAVVLGKKMKYPAAAMRTMTITAVTTTAAPIPDFACSVFIPYVFLGVAPFILNLRLSNDSSSRFTPPTGFPLTSSREEVIITPSGEAGVALVSRHG